MRYTNRLLLLLLLLQSVGPQKLSKNTGITYLKNSNSVTRLVFSTLGALDEIYVRGCVIGLSSSFVNCKR